MLELKVVAIWTGAIFALFVLWWLTAFLKKERARALDLFFFEVKIPKKDSKEDRETDGEEFGSSKDWQKVAGGMTQFFASMHALTSPKLKNKFIGQDFFSCEIAVVGGQISFFIGVPSHTISLVEKQITGFYPDAVIEHCQPPNIFQESGQVASTYLNLKKSFTWPIRTIAHMEKDPLSNIVNALSKVKKNEGAAIQFLLRPVANHAWREKVQAMAEEIHSAKKKKTFLQKINPFVWLGTIFRIFFGGTEDETFTGEKEEQGQLTPLAQERVKAVEEKANRLGFDFVARLITSSPTRHEANVQLANVKGAFDQFTAPDMNLLGRTFHHNKKKVVRDFIFRSFSRPKLLAFWRFLKIFEWRQILSTEEIASIFHFPNIRYNPSPQIKWQDFKIAPAPHNLPEEGLLLGHNIYRGEKKEVRIKRDDRRRHFYLIGKSGTGKSTILENMIRQDIESGEGVCVIDPHGDLIEAALLRIPRERADDIILFDPGDLQRPMGLNLLEAETEEQKEFVAQEALAIFIKLFGEEIMGPRLQHYFRNGVLTLMADDKEGATILDIMRLFTDDPYQKMKSAKVTNPSVRAFWDKEMAGTGQREKEEIIPYFASKFGPFVTNAQVRNILGQTKSGFDFRSVMDGKKILLVNLSKGKLGNLNAKLLGMIMVAKIQMAAMSRVDTPESERADFYLYVDEFQNFVTDSFASILSEARKYRLNLIIAHQYISQITQTSEGGKGKHEDNAIKDAVFGNVGSMMCFKIGAQDAEYMAKEFAPVFTEQDLINIANYQAYLKLNIDNATSRGFSMQTIYDPAGKDHEGAEAFRQLSRLKFAREKEFIEKEIARRVT